ncbi:MAG: hypothetical protein ACKO7W_10705 [Elainella sp.]
MAEPGTPSLQTTSAFQQALETIEALPQSDQELLLEILHQRLRERRRRQLAEEVAEVRQEFAQGQGQFGTASDFLAELDR